MTQKLPIFEVLPELATALRQTGRAVLVAPPGAGKTTVVPAFMLENHLFDGKLIMLEPRRIAARATAEFLAQSFGQEPGELVGYRMRGDSKVSDKTRIEVVTEAVLTRMMQFDPALDGVGAVIFDEFHERSLNSDLGLAFVWEAISALREDLKLVVMSATLDAAPVSKILDHAPIIRSEGRAFAVKTHHLHKPVVKNTRKKPDLIAKFGQFALDAIEETNGGVLIFLPGEGEIRRLNAYLRPELGDEFSLHTLFGAMDQKAQRAAIAPAAKGRKIVLATSIAETSLTIQDVRVVIDMGLARRARFDAASGMSRLVTEPVSKAEAEQRRGRAGRVAEGWCYRFWTKGEEGGLPPFAPPEIETADLAPMALELARWGDPSGQNLSFLTQPNQNRLSEAQNLLRSFGALDDDNRITEHGHKLGKFPVHPRIAHMLVHGGKNAALLGAIWGDRDILARKNIVDFALRIKALQDPRAFEQEQKIAIDRSLVSRLNAEKTRLSKLADLKSTRLSVAQMTALAYPDRVAMLRPGDQPRYLMSNGKGAIMDAGESLATARMIVVTDTDGNPREARIRQAIALTPQELREIYQSQIRWHHLCYWSKRDGCVRAVMCEQFGAIELENKRWNEVPGDVVAKAMLDGVKELGLHLSNRAKQLICRVKIAREAGATMPDFALDTLRETLDVWLLPHLNGVMTATAWKSFDIYDALKSQLDWSQTTLLDQVTPPNFTTPLGRKITIDYSQDVPEISIRLQEMFGVTTHPKAGNIPLRVTLLSPAHRPVQTTTDIPNFWKTSYGDVRKDMRGRYPKHPWPEDPTTRDPTLRTKSARR